MNTWEVLVMRRDQENKGWFVWQKGTLEDCLDSLFACRNDRQAWAGVRLQIMQEY